MSGYDMTLRTLCAAAALLLTFPPQAGGAEAKERALAQAGAAAEVVFDIPPQPLGQALVRLADRAGIRILFASELVAGKRGAAVAGRYTPAQALGILLAGSGLDWRFTEPGTVAVEKVRPGGPMRLGPIAVTAERTVRSLRETASSVAVFDGEGIAARPGLDSTNGILERIPNVTTSGTGNFAPVVRGVDGTGPAQGADAFFAGTRPRLSMQVDGRPLSYNEVVFGDVSLWDVEQVEVLRGHKSTLQGRNAIAGAVVVKTKDPTYHYEAGGRGLVGNLDTRQGSAFVSGPLLEDQVAFRLAFDRRTSESHVHFRDYNGIDPEEFETTMLRGKLLFEPKSLDGFSALATISHSDHSGPQAEFIRRPFRDHVGSTQDMPVFNPKSTGGTLDTTWELSDNLALEGTASLTDVNVKRHAPAGQGNAEVESREVVLEPRVRFSGLDGRLKGVGGLYYFQASQDEFIDFPTPGNFDDHTRTVAAFGEGTYEIFERIDLTLGARVEQEHRRRSGGAGVFGIDLDETYSAFLPKLGLAWHATDAFTIGALASRGYNGGGAGFTYNAPFQSYTFDPEYVWTYEAYTRADLLGGKLALTGNLFYSEYQDMQLPFDLNPDPAVWSVVIRNAYKAVTYGAEAGARWLAAPGLELFAEVGLLKTEVTEYPGSGIEGHELAQSPAFTTSFGASYRHESGLEVSADARFSDAYFSSIDNNARGKTEPHFVLNTQAGYRLSEGAVNLRIFAFISNLLDSDEPIYIEPGTTAGDDVANILRPRTYGIGLEMTF